jgi:hypothetical protein
MVKLEIVLAIAVAGDDVGGEGLRPGRARIVPDVDAPLPWHLAVRVLEGVYGRGVGRCQEKKARGNLVD